MKTRTIVYASVCALILSAAGCSTVSLDLYNLPRTAVRSINVEYRGPEEDNAPQGEIGMILAVAKSIAEAALVPVNVDPEAIDETGDYVNARLFEALGEDIGFELEIPNDSRSAVEVTSTRGEWERTTFYRYSRAPETELAIEVELSYRDAPVTRIGVTEIGLGVSMVYPQVRIRVELTDRRDEVLWRDSFRYTSEDPVPLGSLEVFGVSLHQEYEDTTDFRELVDRAVWEMVRETIFDS